MAVVAVAFTLIVVLVVVFILVIRGLMQRQEASEKRSEQRIERLIEEQKQREIKARLAEKLSQAQAKRRQDAAAIERALEKLGALSDARGTAAGFLRNLREGEAGRLLAGDKEERVQRALSLAREIERAQVPAETIQAQRRELQDLAKALKVGEDSRFKLDDDVSERITELRLGATQKLETLGALMREGQEMLRSARARGVQSAQESLATAAQAKKKREAELRRQALVAEEARATAAIRAKEAAFFAALQTKRSEAELDEALKDFTQDLGLYLSNSEQQRQKKLSEAEVKRAEIDALRARLAVMAEQIRAKALRDCLAAREQIRRDNLWAEVLRNSDIKTTLRPFLDKGFYDYAIRAPNGSLDPYPVSLSYIQSSGALEQTMSGIFQLGVIGCYRKDTQRTRWQIRATKTSAGVHPQNTGFTGYYLARLAEDPGAMEFLKKAQGYLIKYGDVMVEKGWLAP